MGLGQGNLEVLCTVVTFLHPIQRVIASAGSSMTSTKAGSMGVEDIFLLQKTGNVPLSLKGPYCAFGGFPFTVLCYIGFV